METDQVLKVAKQNIGRLQSKKVQYLTPSMLCDISLCYVTFLEITTEATPTIFKNEKERILCFSWKNEVLLFDFWDIVLTIALCHLYHYNTDVLRQ